MRDKEPHASSHDSAVRRTREWQGEESWPETASEACRDNRGLLPAPPGEARTGEMAAVSAMLRGEFRGVFSFEPKRDSSPRSRLAVSRRATA